MGKRASFLPSTDNSYIWNLQKVLKLSVLQSHQQVRNLPRKATRLKKNLAATFSRFGWEFDGTQKGNWIWMASYNLPLEWGALSIEFGFEIALVFHCWSSTLFNSR